MIKINKNKRVGQVVYVVEGAKKEISILSRIFKNIFNFNVVRYSRTDGQPYKKYVNEETDSTIFIVSAKTSNISSIGSQEYLDEKFRILTDDYNLDIANVSMYYVFDRDYKSNTNADLIKNLMSVLKSSMDNGIEQQGLFLMNYPCVESFVVGCFEYPLVKVSCLESDELKSYTGNQKYNLNKIFEKEICDCTTNMLNQFENYLYYQFNVNDLDDFSKHNLDIFNKQESNVNRYYLLPLFILSLVDLGLIEII